MAYQNPLFDVYQNTLGRNPDQAGFDYWNSQMQNGMSLTDIRNHLSSSQEATTGNSYTGNTISWNGGGNTSSFDPTQITNAVNNAVNTSVGQTMTEGLGAATGAITDHTTADGNLTRDAVAGVGQQVGQVGSAVTQGFAGVGNSLNTVQQNQNTINDNMGEGFAATNENLNSGFQGVVDNANTNTQTVVDNTNTGFATAAEQLTAAQAAIMGGQSNLDQLLQDTGSRLDTYYGGLAEGQANLQSSADNLQTDFSDYQTQYGRDVSLAQQSRDDIQNGMMSQTELIRDDMGNGMNAVQQGQSNLMKAVGGVSNAVGSSAPSSMGFASVGGAVTPAAQTAPQANPQITRMKQLAQMAAANPQINPNLRTDFSLLASAFDDAGQLIPRSMEADGSTVARARDDKGFLHLRRFSPEGQPTGTHALHVPTTAQFLEQIMQSDPTGTAQSPYRRA